MEFNNTFQCLTHFSLFLECLLVFCNSHCVLPLLSKVGGPEKKFEVGETKRGRKIFKMKRGKTQLFKLNLGIKKGKDGDFLRQISIYFFKKLPATAKDPFSLDIYCAW